MTIRPAKFRRVTRPAPRLALVLTLAAVALVAPGRAADRPVWVPPCQWEVLATFDDLEIRGFAADLSGRLFVTGTRALEPLRTEVATLRSLDAGASWELVDRYAPPGEAAGAHALHLAGDGRLYVLGWERRGSATFPLLRAAGPGGEPNGWRGVAVGWSGAHLGALASDGHGRLYLALGFHDFAGPGWAVLSAVGGAGEWRVEDVFLPGGDLYSVHPYDLVVTPRGAVLVTGQGNGLPDRWLTRGREAERDREPWTTLDDFVLGRQSYALAGTAIVSTEQEDLWVAGYGVVGNGSDDYLWLLRGRRNGETSWISQRYQLSPGLHSQALDAAQGPHGELLVLGVGLDPSGSNLMLRVSPDGGSTWVEAWRLPGAGDPWRALLSVDIHGDLFVSALVEGVETVHACRS
jgi:hypothetical protein